LSAESVLVLGLEHPENEPELDWWDDRDGGTPGNRQLVNIAKDLKQWLQEEFGFNVHPLPYHVEKGGLFVKDAAILGGIGTLGSNNLVITKEFGPRVRFRALLIDVNLKPKAPIDFTPCQACDNPCRSACPQDAFANGFYSRISCNKQMEADERGKDVFKQPDDKLPKPRIKYCRACELSCPVGK